MTSGGDPVDRDDWFEVRDLGDGIRLIHEPHMNPDVGCNNFFVKGRDRNMIVDTGLGWFSLTGALPWLLDEPIVCVASHTHFDHIGSTHEFAERLVHPAEAAILADPRPVWTVLDPFLAEFGADDIFLRRPRGWDAGKYVVRPAPATGLIAEGDVIDLGDRAFRVIHTPGHSPGGVALFEEATGIMIAGDVVYDGELIADLYHSDIDDYIVTMKRLRADVAPRLVHAGHHGSFGYARYLELIDAFLAEHG